MSDDRKGIDHRLKKHSDVKSAIDMFKEILKAPPIVINASKLIPGKMLFYKYNAKDKTQKYDKTPLVIVLGVSKNYVLGLNFHWYPSGIRKVFVHWLFKMYRKKKGSDFIINYRSIKPMLIKLGAAPVIRLYIRKRISQYGYEVPQDLWETAVNLPSESFTGGISAEKMYTQKVKDYKSKKK